MMELQWWTRLSEGNQKRLKQFLKHRRFAAAFDSLLDILGLWFGVYFGILDKIIAMNCDEVSRSPRYLKPGPVTILQEILHYLGNIHRVWSTILGGNQRLVQMTDQATVEALQLRAPRVSEADSRVLRRLLEDGDIFPTASSEERTIVWNNLQTVDNLIPSLYTFFVDVNYLKDCRSKGMEKLLGKSFKGTVYEAMKERFSGVNQVDDQFVVQETESSFSLFPGNFTDRVEFGYRQIWLCFMRQEEPDLYEVAALADRLGFQSAEIRSLMAESPDFKIARNALLTARKQDRYRYDDANFESFQGQMAAMFATASEVAYQHFQPPLVSDELRESISQRNGRIRDSRTDGGKFLFLKALYESDEISGKCITSFFVRRSVYFAFFGKPVPSRSASRETELELSGHFPNPFRTPIGPADPIPAGQEPRPGQIPTDTGRSIRRSTTVPHEDGLLQDALRREAMQREEVERLRGNLANASRDQARAKEQIDMLHVQKSSLEEIARRFEKEIEGHQHGLVDAKRDQGQAKDQVDELRGQNAALDKKVQGLEKEIEKLGVDLANASRDREQAKNHIEQFRARNVSLEEKVRRFEQEIDDHQHGVASARRDQVQTQGQVDELRTQKASLEEKVRVLEEETKSQQHDLANAGRDQEQAKRQVEELRTQNASLEEKVRGLEGDVSDSRNEQTSSSEHLEKARTERQELSAAYEELKQTNRNLEEDRARAQERVVSISKDLSDVQERLSKAQSETDALRAEVGQLNENKSETNQTLADLTRVGEVEQDLRSEVAN